MIVWVNGSKETLPEATAVGKVLENFRLDAKSVAVELNRRVLDKHEYERTRLSDNDVLEIVHFVGGG